jgi:hypothetical protein
MHAQKTPRSLKTEKDMDEGTFVSLKISVNVPLQRLGIISRMPLLK